MDHQKSVLLISYYYPPTNASGSIRAARFSKYLPANGFQCRVVHCGNTSELRPNVRTVQRVAMFVARLLQYVLKRPSDRLTWVPVAIPLAHEIAVREEIVAILSSSPPISAHLVALLTKLITGKPWIADFRDPFFGNPFDKNSWLARLYCKGVEKAVSRFADHLVANTDRVAKSWIVGCPRLSSKVSTIWNGYDPEEILPEGTEAPKRRLTLLHAGDLYGARSPVRLLASLQRLLKAGLFRSEDLTLRFVGPIEPGIVSQISKFEELRKEGCIECDGMLVDRKRSLQLMKSCTGLILLDLNQHGATLQVPAKLFDYARMGKPVMAFTEAGSPSETILDQAALPHVIIHGGLGDQEADARVLQFLEMQGTDCRASKEFMNAFDGSRQTQQLANIISMVTEGVPREGNESISQDAALVGKAGRC